MEPAFLNTLQNHWDYCNSICVTNPSNVTPSEYQCSMSCFTMPALIACGVTAIVSALALKKLGILTFNVENKKCYPQALSIALVHIPASLCLFFSAFPIAYGITYAWENQSWFVNLMTELANGGGRRHR